MATTPQDRSDADPPTADSAQEASPKDGSGRREPGRGGLSRRGFLAASAAAGAAGLAGSAAGQGQESGGSAVGARAPAVSRGRGRARNVILMISDGMSPGVIALADLARRRGLTGSASDLCAWSAWMNEPGARTTQLDTASSDGPVTDSAAAATAFSTGRRTNNRRLCVLPDGGGEVEPLVPRVHRTGRLAGLVATAHLNHATPAGFIANNIHRENYDAIAEQMLDRGCAVMLGGGTEWFGGPVLAGRADLRVVRDTRSLAESAVQTPGERLLGLFATHHMSYEIDRRAEEPSLAQMTRAAIARLRAHTGGFFLMVEGARVDHAAHANDAATLVREQLAFDDALAAALAFAGGRDDTLVVATTDHGNANPGLALYGADGAEAFGKVGAQRRSFERVFADATAAEQLASDASDPMELARRLDRGTGGLLDPDDLAYLERAIAGERSAAFGKLAGVSAVLGGLLANHHGVGFMSTSHTSDHVPCTASGPGSVDIPGMGHLTDLHDAIAGAMGV